MTGRQIWKWPLEMADRTLIEAPVGARFLTVQTQRGTPCIWAICDTEAAAETRAIVIYGTGHQLPENPGEYIATFQLSGGALVFHAFEVTK